MIRSAHLLCVIILTTVCVACAPAVPPPPGAPPPPVQGAAATCPDGSAFLDHIRFVANGYVPSSNPGTRPVAPPAGIGTPISNSIYAQNLQNAFLLAPPSFQSRLCGLTGIYINGPTTCSALADCIGNSWGFRAGPGQGTYIAVTAGLWNLSCSSGSPYVYHCFETDLLNAVLGSTPQFFRYSGANAAADNFDMTVLAALAHEVGHMQWYQVMTPTRPGTSAYNPNSFCTPSFFSYSWKVPVISPPVWRFFLTLDKRNHNFGAPDRHLLAPDIKDIDHDIDRGDMQDASALVEQLYQPGQPWPSYFGAISPDEDFVETYKFYILTNAQSVPSLSEGPLTSLPIQIAGVQHDIPKDYLAGNKPQLSKKAQCLARVI
jgi:hypothetical protein